MMRSNNPEPTGKPMKTPTMLLSTCWRESSTRNSTRRASARNSKFLRQRPDETAVEFIQVQRQVKLCEFGAAGELLAFDQIVTGISSPHLQRAFFKMGKDFTVQKALSVAREEERVDRALEQFSAAHVDSVSSRRVKMAFPRVGLLRTMANMAAFLPEVRGKMAPAFFLLGIEARRFS